MKNGKNRRSWRFTTGDIADVTGLSRRAVRAAIRDGRFDPARLKSMVLFVAGHMALRGMGMVEPEGRPIEVVDIPF